MTNFHLNIKLLPEERWWGGAVDDGVWMPFGVGDFARDLDPNPTNNQATPFLVSSAGRFVWSEDPFSFVFQDNELRITSKRSELVLGEDCGDLRQAYRTAQASYFPPRGEMPDPLLFTAPQYNTWIELMYDQRQEKILACAGNH